MNPTMKMSRREALKVAGAVATVATISSASLSMSGCSADQWLTLLKQDLPILVQIATSIYGIVGVAKGNGGLDPATAQEIAEYSNEVATDLKTIQALIASYKAASGSQKPGVLGQIISGLTAIQGNLQALLAATHVSNSSLQTTIATSVGLALSAVLAILTLMPQAPPAPSPVTARRKVSRTNVRAASNKPADILKAAANEVFAEGGFSQFAIQ